MLKVLKLVFVFFYLNQIPDAKLTKVISLNQHWSLWDPIKGNRLATDLTLPSGVYSVFEKEKITESVLYSNNDVKLRDVAKKEWRYKLTFTAPLLAKDYQHVFLTFHGIDTFATIILNDVSLGSTNNMYLRYRFDVKSIIKAGEENTIWVRLSSPIDAAFKEANSSQSVPPPKCPNDIINGECHINLIRKLPISFGSEFSPAVPSMGIWKPVDLELYNTAIIRDVTYKLQDQSDSWLLDARVYFEMGQSADSVTIGSLSAEISVDSPDPIKVTQEVDIRTQSDGEYMEVIKLKIPKKDVKLWWPTGHGKQKLYILQVEFQDSSNNVINKREWRSTKLLKVGFRTVELVQDAVESGTLFAFKINGKPIFMKGANYVPLDILPEFSYDEARLRHLLRNVQHANMNMLRVYAGGYYESDLFYSIADDYGILIWQEAIFPPAMYPNTYPYFTQFNIRKEVVQNVRRTQHHASLIHWSTNHQNELALRDDRFGTKAEFDTYKNRYQYLYYNVVWNEILNNDPWRTPTISSPNNGLKDFRVVIGENPQDPNYGDVHVFLTEGNLWQHGAAPRARFVSAFGFQSLPSIKSVKQYKRAQETYDQFITHREHQVDGIEIIENQLSLHLPPIPRTNEKGWEYFAYASEISQAMIVAAQIDTYRIEKGREDTQNTMGAIVWQLNDVWTAPSWSAIEHTGRLKVLWNVLQDSFFPEVVVGLMNEDKKLDAYIVNEEEGTPNRYNLIIRFYRFGTLGYNEELVEDFEVEPNHVKLVKTLDVYEIIRQKGGDFHEYFIKLLLRRKNSDTTLSRDFVFLTPLKDALRVQNPQLIHKIATEDCDHQLSTVSIEIKISRPALFVTLDVVGITLSSYWFSTNGYTQVEPIKVVHLFYNNPSCELRKLVDADIKVWTMNDILLI